VVPLNTAPAPAPISAPPTCVPRNYIPTNLREQAIVKRATTQGVTNTVTRLTYSRQTDADAIRAWRSCSDRAGRLNPGRLGNTGFGPRPTRYLIGRDPGASPKRPK
jgi:hypothetical protein